MKKVLVTGGAGYIGAHTALELIRAGYETILIDNFSKSDRTLLRGIERVAQSAVTFYEGDCADPEFLENVFSEQKNIAAVLHFAAYKSVGESVENPLMYYRNNVTSMIALLEVMKKFGVRDLIFSSSCTVYGQPDIIPVSEDAPFKRAESPYGATKQMCERIIEDAFSKGYRIISLRYFNPIGAHPSGLLGELPIGSPNNLVPYITQTAIGVREKLTIFGKDYHTPDGTCIRDFIHVVDLAMAHIKAMEYLDTRPEQTLLEILNLGTGIGVSVLELVSAFIKVTGVELPYAFGPRRPGDVEKVYASPLKAIKTLNWRPQFTIEDSLAHAWQWEKNIRKKN